MAGAVGYNLPVESPNGICLVNIGGGSTDIAAISANSIITGVNVGIGGTILDKAIEENRELIVDIAKQCIKDEGYTYDVSCTYRSSKSCCKSSEAGYVSLCAFLIVYSVLEG